MSVCPKCGVPKNDGPQCNACGVFYAKAVIRPASEKKKLEENQDQDDKKSSISIPRFKSCCDACGRSVTGISHKLKRAGDRYLCENCIKNPDDESIYACQDCHTRFAHFETKGSTWVALALLFLGFLPGVIYVIWMSSGKKRICPKCKGANIIDSSTHVECPECAELISRQAKKCRYCGAKFSS